MSDSASSRFQKEILSKLEGLDRQVAARSFTASHYLRNSSLAVLRGTRSGKTYKKPDTGAPYVASAPGEAPASRTDGFREHWDTYTKGKKNGKNFIATAGISSKEEAGDFLLGDLLENGTSRMAPRPYKEAVQKGAESKIKARFSKPYYL